MDDGQPDVGKVDAAALQAVFVDRLSNVCGDGDDQGDGDVLEDGDPAFLRKESKQGQRVIA